MISRERANEIGTAAIRGDPKQDDPATISQIASRDEIPSNHITTYNLKGDLEDYWIVYLRRPSAPWALKESEVMLISKADGEIAYWGGAGDEG